MPTTRRTIAIAGAVVAVGAAGLMTVGVAAAVEPGRCLENVNVRAEPSIDSAIVAVCEAGTPVTTGRITDGFVQLTDLEGWAAAEYIEVDGRPAGEPGSAPSSPSRSTGDGPVRSTDDRSTDDRSTDDRSTDDRGAHPSETPRTAGPGEPYDDELTSTDDPPRRTPGPLDGLLP